LAILETPAECEVKTKDGLNLLHRHRIVQSSDFVYRFHFHSFYCFFFSSDIVEIYQQRGIFSKVDAVRTGLNNVIKDYEMTTVGTQ